MVQGKWNDFYSLETMGNRQGTYLAFKRNACIS
jgi:hypothetical protein